MNVKNLFDAKEEKILSQTEALHKALTHLRYEGKLLRKQNIEAVQILILSLELVLEKHRHLQEDILFPFLQRHIPRHEAAISLMETEHEDIVRSAEKLKKQVLKISKDSDPLGEGKVYETGIYLVTLLRHHICFEEKNISQSMQRELREDEKEVIQKRVRDCLKKGW